MIDLSIVIGFIVTILVTIFYYLFPQKSYSGGSSSREAVPTYYWPQPDARMSPEYNVNTISIMQKIREQVEMPPNIIPHEQLREVFLQNKENLSRVVLAGNELTAAAIYLAINGTPLTFVGPKQPLEKLINIYSKYTETQKIEFADHIPNDASLIIAIADSSATMSCSQLIETSMPAAAGSENIPTIYLSRHEISGFAKLDDDLYICRGNNTDTLPPYEHIIN